MKRIWNKFIVYFVNGIALLLPVVLTFFVIKFLVVNINDAILNPVIKLLEPIVGKGQQVYAAKTIVFFSVLIIIAGIGWGAKIIIINRIFSLGESLLLRVPVMGKLYKSAKQIFSALIGQGKTIFKEVVVIEYPRNGLYSIGFTTGTTRGELKDKLDRDLFNVFVPTTPNPTSGIFLIVPEEDVVFLRMTVEEGLKLVVSGGAVTPPAPEINAKED